ncbi:MAG: TonB-dependent receptor [Rhodanobacter sp.]|nr:MAG: TonB-dependent receptor [Rhodanobacter sp.]TAM13686.1 MAG: TonB-dependent receptor [Rhodanobacter sp.]TAM35838.1 MAG: TonB-dependent receptor [Rhodanobacter sp.]
MWTGVVSALFLSGTAMASTGPAAAAEAQTNPQTTGDQSPNPSAQATKPPAQPAKASPQKATTLQAVNVVGILASQMNDIQLKRSAPNIQDSITAQSIGQLPDITITDSLQRITGVQIDRSAGEGSTVNVRGLPEVSTLLNGEAFISADNIDSIQPNYQSMPASLFTGVDVYKSPTGQTLNSGISGTINLRTRRPWDMKDGWTFAGTAEGVRSSVVESNRPEGNVFASYNAGGHWGALVGISYSDTYSNNSSNGLGQFEGRLQGENASAANEPGDGYLTGWSGVAVPSQIKQFPDGSVDVNGDGKSNGAFYQMDTLNPFTQQVRRKRTGANASVQYDFGSGFTLTADGFLTRQTQLNLGEGAELMPVSWLAATNIPVKSRDTGVLLTSPSNNPGEQDGDWNQHFFTTQAYQKYLGDWLSYSQGMRIHSLARNFNVALQFDNGGAFTGDLRFVNGTASQTSRSAYAEFSQSNGTQWPNTLMPGVSLDPGVYVYPSNLGGNHPFNPGGFDKYAVSVIDDMSGPNPVMTIPAPFAARLTDPNTYVLKTMSFENDYNAHSGMNIVRANGHYAFSDDFKLDFGLRNSIRTANEFSFDMMAPVYAGNGASDPQGCYAHWMAADVVLDGGGVPGACTAGNQYGFFRSGALSTQRPGQLPSIISSHWRLIRNPGNVQGITEYALDPAVMQDPVGFEAQLYPGAIPSMNPATSWDVMLKERTGYAQADFNGVLAGLPFSGNFGLRVVRTNLTVDQHLNGEVHAYGVNPSDGGIVRTKREYTDWLPAINFALDLTPKAVLRLSASKNMMPLTLDQWGGGLNLDYAFTTLPDGKSVFAVQDGQSNGNPNLAPWRSTNYDASLEYYFSNTSMFSVDLFDIRVAKFITAGGTQRCDLPDQDGVARGRCIIITGPIQGSGQQLKGIETDYRQAFTFLPGLLANTGLEVNATYSPSNTGRKDLAGRDVPFPDNSEKSGNLIVWYQDSHWQARVAANYRSRRAVETNYGGITGMELYQEPTTYIDASVSYQIDKNFQVFAQGSNLTNEKQRFYLVWPDQRITNRYSDRQYMLGVRANF